MTVPIIIIAIVLNLLLLVSLLVVLPRLLRRSDTRSAEEALRLREMLLDVLSEQEAVTLRQNQIGVAVSRINQDLGRIADEDDRSMSPEELARAAGFPHLEHRIETLQTQLAGWFKDGAAVQHSSQVADAQSWGNLMSLLANMQDRMAVLSSGMAQQVQPHVAAANDRLLMELEDEMNQLRALADEIAGLQWKLRRSVLERESNLANLRAQIVGGPAYNHRAA
ncbi:MAG: hypothetical protein NVS4B8_17070 [Herpetosiphon sp.]